MTHEEYSVKVFLFLFSYPTLTCRELLLNIDPMDSANPSRPFSDGVESLSPRVHTVVVAEKRMSLSCPRFSKTLIIADDARLAAQVSCVFNNVNTYLTVLDGPRLSRMDHESEVIRRNNATARVRPDRVIFAGVSDEVRESFKSYLPMQMMERVNSYEEIENLKNVDVTLKDKPMVWGTDRIGVGLLKALRSKSQIVFNDEPSTVENVPSCSGHLVVCEQGVELSQVIAANYAYSLGAGLCLIPEVPRAQVENILERFYGLYDSMETSPTQKLKELKSEMLALCGELPIPEGGSITFFTRRLPFGFAIDTVPSTHLNLYPDLGVSIVNGFAQEQPQAGGLGIAVLVDPDTTPAPEIDAAANVLDSKGMFVRVYRGLGANVHSIAQMIEFFPYELLIIATHCGDTSGYRWTYEFKDSEGIDRSLVVDIAIGIGQVPNDDLLRLTEFTHFHSLDGVDWHDPDKKEKLYIGTAIKDFIELTKSDGKLEPVKKENIQRVVGSAVLRMYDHNYIPVPHSLAGNRLPIILNNACTSWHRLAETFTFGNARAYIGTLFMISTTEAHEVALKLLGKHFEKLLPIALWRSQNEVYGDSVRRPYVINGVFTQRIQVSNENIPLYLLRLLSNARNYWKSQTNPKDTWTANKHKEIQHYYERELASLRRQWFSNPKNN